MEHQSFQILTAIFGLLVTVIGFCIAWWVNASWAQGKANEKDLAELKVKLAEHYMPRAELEKKLDSIFLLLQEIQKEVRHA